MENSKTTNRKDTTVYHTAYGKRWLFALRAALLQISVSQTNGATRNNYATGLGCVLTSLFARFRHAAVAVGREKTGRRGHRPLQLLQGKWILIFRIFDFLCRNTVLFSEFRR